MIVGGKYSAGLEVLKGECLVHIWENGTILSLSGLHCFATWCLLCAARTHALPLVYTCYLFGLGLMLWGGILVKTTCVEQAGENAALALL